MKLLSVFVLMGQIQSESSCDDSGKGQRSEWIASLSCIFTTMMEELESFQERGQQQLTPVALSKCVFVVLNKLTLFSKCI